MSVKTGQGLDNLTPLQRAALVIKELRNKLHRIEEKKHEPIAIVGMSGRFPGAENIDAYWDLLINGREAIQKVPSHRWDADHFFDPNPNAPGKISSPWGGFLESIDEFDAAFFNISPLEALHMDPQHRLLLEATWHALEDAGQPPALLRGSRSGVFVGITQNDYAMMHMAGSPDKIQAYTGTGNGFCFAAGRISFLLGLNGPTWSVDTACSSSLTALHQACQALRSGECDLALVAGVQLNLTPSMHIFLSRTQSLSPHGRCFTFDERADGFTLGEGVGVVVLRRQTDAIAQGDRIRALLRSTALNHDGHGSGLTIPNESAQEALVSQALSQAGLGPEDIDYVEAHGTATKLGDPIEMGSLSAVFGKGQRTQPLKIGSVKANIGHLSAAAGISGLIKVVLMLEKERMVPQPNFKQPNPKIPWKDFSVQIPTSEIPWHRSRQPRRAGLNSFGLSGTNVHAILEEAPLAKNHEHSQDSNGHQGNPRERPVHLLALSACNHAALQALVRSHGQRLNLKPNAHHPQGLELKEKEAAQELADLCFSANTGRNHFRHRLAIPAASIDEVKTALNAFIHGAALLNGDAGPDFWHGQIPRGGMGPTALLFADDVPMDQVRHLAETQPLLAEILDRCQALSQTHLGTPLFTAWDSFSTAKPEGSPAPKSEGLPAARSKNSPAVRPEGSPAAKQENAPARFACQHGLSQLWQSWGLDPAMIWGSGVGELTAACFAGVFDLEQAFQVLAGKTVKGRPPRIGISSAQTGKLISSDTWNNYQLPAQGGDIAAAAEAFTIRGCRILAAIGTTSSLSPLNLGEHQNRLSMMTDGDDDPWQYTLELLARLYVAGLEVDWHSFDTPYVRQRVGLPVYPFQRRRFWLDPPEASPDTRQNSAAASSMTQTANPASTAPASPASQVAHAHTALLQALNNAAAPSGALPIDMARLMNLQIATVTSLFSSVVELQLEFMKKMVKGGRGLETPENSGGPTGTKSQPGKNELIPPCFPSPRTTGSPLPGSTTRTPESGMVYSSGKHYLLLMAAPDEAALEKGGDDLVRHLEENSTGWLEQHTGQHEGRTGQQEQHNNQQEQKKSSRLSGNFTKGDRGMSRRMVLFQDIDDACSALRSRNPKQVFTARADKRRSLVMMFPGVGDHYLGMGRGLYEHFPGFKQDMEKCCSFLEPELGLDLRDVLYPSSLSGGVPDCKVGQPTDPSAMAEKKAAPVNPNEQRLNQTVHIQPLIFIIEYALGRLWLDLGLRPAALVGYSIGEYAAACLAGVMTLKDALSLVAQRAKMIETLPRGVMLALPMSKEKAQPLLGQDLSLSIVSTSAQCVVGGPEEAISALEKELTEQQIVSRRLPGTHAFHSHMMAPLQNKITELVKGFQLHAPEIPYLSNVTGTWISREEATDPSHWARHTCRTVRFAECVDQLMQEEGRVLLETGPGQSLGSFVLQHPRTHRCRDKIVLPSLRNRYEGTADERFFLNTMGKLWLSGIEF